MEASRRARAAKKVESRAMMRSLTRKRLTICSSVAVRSGYSWPRESISRPIVLARASGLFPVRTRSEEHTSELQSRLHLLCRLLLDKNIHTTPAYVRSCTDDT